MLNKKMSFVAWYIDNWLRRVIPEPYYTLVFVEERIGVSDVVTQVMVECCKHAFDVTSPTRSVSAHAGGAGQVHASKAVNSERGRLQRALDYAYDYRTRLYGYGVSHGLNMPDGLLPPSMETIEEQLAGYQLTDFQRWELDNIRNMDLVKAIAEGRITSSKSVSIDDFLNIANQYDGIIREFQLDWENPEANAVFDFLALFTLEWRYSFDFFYELACEMSKNGVKKIPTIESRLPVFCTPHVLSSAVQETDPELFGSQQTWTDARMLVLRRRYVHDIVTAPDDEFGLSVVLFEQAQAFVVHALQCMPFEGMSLFEWFEKNSTPEDWGSVFREYDVFQAFVYPKEWEDDIKKVANVRKMIAATFHSLKNPGFRAH